LLAWAKRFAASISSDVGAGASGLADAVGVVTALLAVGLLALAPG
jgi:hypothetical protein